MGYDQIPEGVIESENFKILWDSTVQCDRKIEQTLSLLIRRRKKLT